MKKIVSFLVLSLFIAIHAESARLSTDVNVSESASIRWEGSPSALYSRDDVEIFYKNFNPAANGPVWFDTSLTLTQQGADLLNAILSSYTHGLNPEKYHSSEIIHLMQNVQPGLVFESSEQFTSLRKLDILFTDAYLTLGKDLYYGVTDWDALVRAAAGKKEKFLWDRPKKNDVNLTGLLAESLRRNAVTRSLDSLAPDYGEYRRLMAALQNYRIIQSEGGWGKIPSGKTIRIGDKDGRLPLIKKRLLVTKEFPATITPDITVYIEPQLIEAVKRFQKEHNLSPDGTIGEKTLLALNIPVETKMQKLLLNLERYRWLEHGLEKGEGYIDVNIPSFQMTVYESGFEIFTMRTIVGKKKRPTPVLSSKLAYAVLNPSWTAPETIVREDIIGKEDIETYLLDHNMRIYNNRNGDKIEIDPEQIDWSKYAGKKHIPFTFIADSGESNPLGGVKFMFPNKHSVYMHDTNTPYLFKQPSRAFSSGCIRLNEPQKLLNYLMQNDENLINDPETVNTESDKILNLKKKIPVVFRYMTVSATKDLEVIFYDDIYGYDDLLFSVIKQDIQAFSPIFPNGGAGF